MEQKETRQRIRLLMVGVGPKCIGGMWSVAKSYIDSTKLNEVADITGADFQWGAMFFTAPEGSACCPP